ncbi:hypothetical protein LguiB_004174 [Lonicera macranthoides]
MLELVVSRGWPQTCSGSSPTRFLSVIYKEEAFTSFNNQEQPNDNKRTFDQKVTSSSAAPLCDLVASCQYLKRENLFNLHSDDVAVRLFGYKVLYIRRYRRHSRGEEKSEEHLKENPAERCVKEEEMVSKAKSKNTRSGDGARPGALQSYPLCTPSIMALGTEKKD